MQLAARVGSEIQSRGGILMRKERGLQSASAQGHLMRSNLLIGLPLMPRSIRHPNFDIAKPAGWWTYLLPAANFVYAPEALQRI
jgi:hypothetical protein